MNSTILLHSNQLGIRGTEVALYDYANILKEYGHRPIIVYPNGKAEAKIIGKFVASHLPVLSYYNSTELQSIAETIQADCAYFIKAGFNDGLKVEGIPNYIHAVFKHREEHGTSYAYVSKWLSQEMSNGQIPYVPHYITSLDTKADFRKPLNLQGKLVVGHYSGNSFDIPFAKEVVERVAKKRKDIAFIFMNVDPFCALSNVYFFEQNEQLVYKDAFINTSDIMLHARERGETYGLSVGEFSVKDRPILTYSESPERNHIQYLGDNALYYSNADQLEQILLNIQFSDILGKDWVSPLYKRDSSKEFIYNQFKSVFLDAKN